MSIEDDKEIKLLEEALAEALAREVKLKEEAKVLNRQISVLQIQNGVLGAKVSTLKAGLEKYADKNFWIRVPPYTLAQADKGAIAAETLRMAYEGSSSNA